MLVKGAPDLLDYLPVCANLTTVCSFIYPMVCIERLVVEVKFNWYYIGVSLVIAVESMWLYAYLYVSFDIHQGKNQCGFQYDRLCVKGL